MPSSEQGLFLTFEGIEGSGKSTQTALLVRCLRDAGYEVVATREPGGGGRLGSVMRELLKDPEIWRELRLAEVYLYAAARAHHLESLILPELDRGAVVVCDRFLDSTRAYQSYGRGRSLELVDRLHQLPPLDRRPDRTLLLDLPPETGLRRARERIEEGQSGYDDEDLQFFERVRAGFVETAVKEPARFRTIDADRPIDVVHTEVVAAVADLASGIVPCRAELGSES